MTWTQVARKDFEDAVRSKMLWSIVAVFVGFMGFLLLVAANNFEPDTVDAPVTDAALAFVATFAQLFVPLVALIAGYMSVVGERRSGSLRILLGYPHSRRDVVVGKLLGRAGVITLTFLAGFALMTLVVTVLFSFPAVDTFLPVVAAATLFGLAFTGIAVGVSAGTTTRGKAMALAIGLFLLALMFWDGIVAGLYFAVNGSLPGIHADAWYFLLKQLNPITAYSVLVQSFLESPIGSIVNLPVEDIPPGTTPEQLKLENRVEGPLPFYLKDWFAGVILGLWAIVPVVLGYLRFEGSDL